MKRAPATGLGTTRNLPIEFGTPRESIANSSASELEKFAAQIRPQLVLVSAGFDSHRDDPIGSLGLEVEDFARADARSCSTWQNVHAGGRVVSLLEGGYNPLRLAECVAERILRGLTRYRPKSTQSIYSSPNTRVLSSRRIGWLMSSVLTWTVTR